MSETLNMELELQTPLTTPGPTWANTINNNFSIIDAHNHTTGNGVTLSQAAVFISGNYAFNEYCIVDAGGVRFTDLTAAPSTPTDANGIYSVNGDLYWVNDSGVPVQITSGTGINISSVGTIGGDYGQVGVTASAVYSNTTKTFSWTQASGVAAKMATGSVIVYNESAGVQGVTMAAKSTTAQYTLSFPIVAPNTANMIRVYDAAGDSVFKTITTDGTLTVTPSSSTYLFSLPQSIAASATPTFAGLTTNGTTTVNGTLSATLFGTVTSSLFQFVKGSGSDPSSTSRGTFYWDTTTNQLSVRYDLGGAYGTARIPKDATQSYGAGSQTFYCAYYNTFSKTGGTGTYTLDGMYDGQTVTILVSSTGSGYTITWNPTLKWNSGIVPTPTVTAGRYDRYVIQRIGSNYFGSADMNCY